MLKQIKNMKINFQLLGIYLIILFSIGISGCLKDNVSTMYDIKLSDNAKVLYYLEESGDYINSSEMPSVVNVDEVYYNLNNYLVIDTRTKSEYAAGHISGAVNIQNDSLINFFNSIDAGKYQKIILVNSDGQASSYYTCLLRLYGIQNVYSLLFGMAQWNTNFSEIWTKNIGDSPVTQFFTFGNYINDSLSNLPNIHFPNSNSAIQSNVKNRIAEILQTGFVDNETYVKVDPPGALEFNGEEASNFYIVCFGIRPFYNQNPMDPVSKGRFPNSVSFVPGEDLKSTNNLQLLPDNKKIVVYSYSGQMSAFVVAYLRVLGYDARSLLYGGNMLFYSFMTAKIDAFTPFVFLASDIKNYQYITGSSSK